MTSPLPCALLGCLGQIRGTVRPIFAGRDRVRILNALRFEAGLRHAGSFLARRAPSGPGHGRDFIFATLSHDIVLCAWDLGNQNGTRTVFAKPAIRNARVGT